MVTAESTPVAVELEGIPEPEVVTVANSIGYFKFSCNSAAFAKAISQARRVIRTMSIHPAPSPNVKIYCFGETNSC
ncbi:hypothetical protein [Nostoc sp.]